MNLVVLNTKDLLHILLAHIGKTTSIHISPNHYHPFIEINNFVEIAYSWIYIVNILKIPLHIAPTCSSIALFFSSPNIVS